MRSQPQGEFILRLEELEEWIKTAKSKDQVTSLCERMVKTKKAFGPSSCIQRQSVAMNFQNTDRMTLQTCENTHNT